MPWKPDGRAQQTSPERILPRTRWFQHWEHSQQPSPTQPSFGEPRRVGTQLQNSMIRCGWKYGDWEWNANFKKGRPEEEKIIYRTVQSSPVDATKTTDLNFKKAVESGAPSRVQGPSPPPPTRAPILEEPGVDGTTKKVEDLDGRTKHRPPALQ